MVLDCKEQQPSQLGAQEVHKTVKDNFLVYMKAELVGNLPEITVCEFCLAMEKSLRSSAHSSTNIYHFLGCTPALTLS